MIHRFLNASALPSLLLRAVFLVSLLCVAAAGPGRAQNLVSNGGFEAPVVPGFLTRYVQGQTIGNWVISEGSVDVVSQASWQPREGNQSLDLSGGLADRGAGTIYQDLPTVPGQMYRLRFFMSGNPDPGSLVKRLDVFWNDEPLGRQHFDRTGYTPANMGWSQREFFVAATGQTSRLTFRGLEETDRGAVIDAVSVTATAPWSAVGLSTGADNRTRVVWRHTSGVMSFWNVSPLGQQEGWHEYGPFPGWAASFVATGADNRSRVLWTNPDGAASLWGLSPLGIWEGYTEYGPFTGWSPAALSIGADNFIRLLWRHLNGTVSVHLLAPNGAFQRYVEHGPFDGWRAIAMGTGGDNRTRLLWVHPDNQAASVHWLTPNGNFERYIEYGPFPGWTPALLDVGKTDNRTRLVWRHDNGRISFWTLTADGAQVGFREHGPFPGWTATALSVGADNRTRLLWTHDTGAVSLWLISADGQQEGYVQYGPFF